MKAFLLKFKQSYLQIVLYLFVNVLFILKYTSRTEIPAAEIAGIYIVLIAGVFYLYRRFFDRVSSHVFKQLSISLLSFAVLGVIIALICVDPYTIRVDRWSAVSFFLEALFSGNYPYAVHTHVSETNFPSPFPIWHIINIPFYLLGDVGIGLVFFIVVTFVAVQFFFSSYHKTFFFLLLLFLSPAYWWEVVVRSDSLSNAFLVFIFILWYSQKKISIEKSFILTIFCCGLITSTRLSAIIPVALFLFASYTKLNWTKKLIFPAAILGLVVLTFLPFVLWTVNDNWVFFSRNPFMSQTSVGNPILLMGMIALGVVFAMKWKNMTEFFNSTAVFMFLFILVSQISLILTRGVDGSLFNDSTYDISYFTLFLPYSIMALVAKTTDN